MARRRGAESPLANRPENFWAKVVIAGPDECWLFTGCRNLKGYGYTAFQGKTWQAHRLAFVLDKGWLPEGLVLHSCDTPPCCNPKHLRDGTAKENTADMYARNRQRFRPNPGSLNGNSVLDEEQVLAIKEMFTGARGEYGRIASIFNVGLTTIKNIAYGNTWKHVKGLEYDPDSDLWGV